MPVADHGGFDVVAEIPEATALTIARSLSFAAGTRPFANNRVTGTVNVAATVSAVSFLSPNRLVLDIDIAGTQIRVSRVTVFGAPMDVAPWMQLIQPRGLIRINAPLTMTAGHSLVVTLAPTGTDPIVTVTLVEDSILASPLVTMLLAQAILQDPQNDALYQQVKATVLGEFRAAIEAQIRQTLTELGTVTLAPAPALPSSSSGAANLIAASAFVMLPRSLKICYATRTGIGTGILTGTAPSTAAITTSNLVRSTVTGVPVDAMAICCSNAFILRDIVRDGLTVPALLGGLGVPLQSFQTSHPLMLIGPVVTTAPGPPIPGVASVTYNSIFGGIDGTNIRVLINMTLNGRLGAFSISASIDAAFSVTAGPGPPPSLVVGLVGTPTVRTDLSIAPWVYLGALVAPFVGVPLATILAAADLFAGSVTNGPIAAAIAGLAGSLGGTFSAPLGPGLPPLTVRPPVSLGQSNAIRRTVAATVPGLSFTLPIVDPFLDNDILLTLV